MEPYRYRLCNYASPRYYEVEVNGKRRYGVRLPWEGWPDPYVVTFPIEKDLLKAGKNEFKLTLTGDLYASFDGLRFVAR